MFGVNMYPIVASIVDIIVTVSSVCVAMWFICFWSFLPLCCATRIVPAMLSPIPSDIIRNIMGKLIDTDATAFVPSLPTQNVSVSW